MLTDLEWISQIYSDIESRAASLRQLSFLFCGRHVLLSNCLFIKECHAVFKLSIFHRMAADSGSACCHKACCAVRCILLDSPTLQPSIAEYWLSSLSLKMFQMIVKDFIAWIWVTVFSQSFSLNRPPCGWASLSQYIHAESLFQRRNTMWPKNWARKS